MWNPNGVIICKESNNQQNPIIVEDGSGGAIIAWTDERSEIGNKDIYAQRVDSSGVTQWGIDGLPICTADSTQDTPLIAGSGDGAIVVLTDKRSGDWDIYGSTSTDGTTWSTEQRLVASNDNDDQTSPALVVDGQSPNRAHVVWREGPVGNRDIYIATSGDGFATNAVTQITVDPSEQTEPAIAVDASNGLYVLWTDGRNASEDIYGAAGSPWTNVAVVTKAAGQSSPVLAVESAGAMLHMLWVDGTSGDSGIYYASSDGLPGSPLTGSNVIDGYAVLATELSVGEISAALTMLQLKGLVRRIAGARFLRVKR